MKKKKVVVLGLCISGAAIVRNLSRKGYEVWGVTDDKKHEGLHSRYGQKLICPDPEHNFSAWLDFMKELSKKIKGKPALIPTGDKFVVAVEKNIEELRPYYRMHQTPKRLHTQLTSKLEQVRAAKKHGFPVPKSKEIKNSNELISFYKKIQGPVIIKPEFSYFWHGSKAEKALDDAKILVASSIKQAKNIYERAKPYSKKLLAQELIPGSDDNLFYWTGIIGKNNRIGGSLIGKKIRVVPPGKGSASFVQLVDLPELEKQCQGFLKELGYRGICGIEVKYDARDKKYKLIEINPRYGLWEDIGIPVGIDLAKEAVDEMYGSSLTQKKPSSFKQKWVSLHRDFQVYMDYRKQHGLSIPSWLSSLQGPIVINDFPLFTDTPYALHNAMKYFMQFINKIRKEMKK